MATNMTGNRRSHDVNNRPNSIRPLMGWSVSSAKINSTFDKTISRIDEAINTETGGDTFCYLDFYYLTRGYFGLNVVRVGKYPLRNVSLTILDQTQINDHIAELAKNNALQFEASGGQLEEAMRLSTTTLLGRFLGPG
jgi:hypothetical protein